MRDAGQFSTLHRSNLMTTRNLFAILALSSLALAADVAVEAQSKPQAQSLSDQAVVANTQASQVIDFWKQAGPTMWFAKDAEFDRLFREKFLALHDAAMRGDLKHWETTDNETLALLLLLDQFPRNAFRGTPRMYASDGLARKIANAAIDKRFDRKVPTELRLFMYLPLGHSEDLGDQERAVALVRSLGEPHVSHAMGHRDIIKRFGRFPHRNPILGRKMKPDEQKFLDEGGFAG
jgi:uncharacterized protein (DUF924 family)